MLILVLFINFCLRFVHLFKITFLLIFISISLKYVFFVKSVKSFLLSTFAGFNYSLNFSFVSLLTSWLVIYLSWLGIFFQFYQLLCYSTIVGIAWTFLTNSSNKVFLTTSFFAVLFSLLKSTGIVFSLPITNLLISDFKLTKSVFLAKFDVSTPVVFYKSDIVAFWDKSNSTFVFVFTTTICFWK